MNGRRLILAATALNTLFWLSLISVSWVVRTVAIGTFMFQFLHFTSFLITFGDAETDVRVVATLTFLTTDVLALILRCVSPVLDPWSAMHILAVVNSIIFLLIGLFQGAVFWIPYFRQQGKNILLRK